MIKSSALRIQYIYWGGHAKDNRHKWCAILNRTGEVWDYGSLKELMIRAEKVGLSYEIVKRRKSRQKRRSITTSHRKELLR